MIPVRNPCVTLGASGQLAVVKQGAVHTYLSQLQLIPGPVQFKPEFLLFSAGFDAHENVNRTWDQLTRRRR